MSTELLPCPFCGADAKWSHHPDHHNFFDGGPLRVWRWQSCITCTMCRLPHCSGFGTVIYEGGNALAHQRAMRDAARQWNRRTTPGDSADAPVQQAGKAEALAKKLYAKHTDNHPTIHCNRFPAWDELSATERDEWRAKARAALKGEQPVERKEGA